MQRRPYVSVKLCMEATGRLLANDIPLKHDGTRDHEAMHLTVSSYRRTCIYDPYHWLSSPRSLSLATPCMISEISSYQQSFHDV
jgi:hypothetical protein